MGRGRDEARQCARGHVRAAGPTCCSLSDAMLIPVSGVRVTAVAPDLSLRGVILTTPVTSLGLSFPMCRAEAVTSVVFLALLPWCFHEEGLFSDSGMSRVRPVATKMPLNTKVSPELPMWLKKKI